ncbi:DUF4259 domain-containing protein [Micromonospora sp. HM5-17]|jgi:hypothetical protein|uniref:DUF4259 domain-containing protein n=1 Tax=Micromonospora sp. HM5-17 TaxID=2487710 RepID=UPI00131574DE|nr:DUF4259 domain-containing protein [Micromonospora sp. HM5-17]
MATWQLGPFDNDDAVDWCGTLKGTNTPERLSLVRRTLERAAQAGPALGTEDAARAIAAAATVSQALTGTPPSDSAYAPRFLGPRDIPVSPSLLDLAGRALDAVLAEGSAWRQQWVGHIEEEEAVSVVERLRAGLAPIESETEVVPTPTHDNL